MTNNGNITCRYCKKVIWFFQDHTCKPKEILEKKELGMGKKKQKKQTKRRYELEFLNKKRKCQKCKWKNSVAIFRKKYLCKKCYEDKRIELKLGVKT